MGTIANWNGHTFVVSPNLIRSFTDMKIKGGCETEDNDSGAQKYVEHKSGEPAEITLTVRLSAQMGVTDVYTEAMSFVTEAGDGASAYFYMGESKLIPARMMLTKAEVEEIEHLPGRGDQWISASVKLTLQQASNTDTGGGNGSRYSYKQSGTSGGGGGSGSGAGTSGGGDTDIQSLHNPILTGLNAVKELITEAKEASAQKEELGGLYYQIGLIARATQTEANTFTAINPTTQRVPGAANFKVLTVK